MSHPLFLERSIHWLERMMDGAVLFLALVVPFVWIPWGSNQLELPKQTIVIAVAVLGFLAWLAVAFMTNRFAFPRSWDFAAVVVFVASLGLLAAFASSRFLALVGDAGQLPWSFATVLSLALLVFLIMQRMQSVRSVHALLHGILFVSLLLAVFGILQAMRGESFTPVGSIYGLSVYLTAPLMLAVSQIAQKQQQRGWYFLSRFPMMAVFERILPWVTAILSLWLLLLTNVKGAWIAVGAGSVILLVAALLRFRRADGFFSVAIPAGLLIVSVCFFVFRSPLTVRLSPEVSPSASASWELARQVLTSRPVQGSGQGTWMYDYARFRPASVNQTPFWDVRFERAYSTFLTLLPTVGLLGTGGWLLLLAMALWRAWRTWFREPHGEGGAMLLSCLVGFVTLSSAAFVYNFSMSHQALWWLLFGLLLSLSVRQLIVWRMDRQGALSILASAVGGFFVISAVGVFWLLGQRFSADIYSRRVANAFQKSRTLDEVIWLAERARSLNPRSDAYARDAAEAHLSKAQLLLQKRPAPEQLGPVYQEVAAATEHALAAANLEPQQAQNWLTLGFLYERIMKFTKGADEHAMASFERAAALEPASPVEPTVIGGIWFARSETARSFLDSKDPEMAKRARGDFQHALQKSEESLKKAVALKSDYLPAHYRLAAIAERRGRLPDAIREMETILRIDNKDAGVAFELAILYYRNRERERARILLEQVVRAQGDNENARWYLAAVYEEEGRLGDALALLRPLLAKMPANIAVQERVRRLEEGIRSPGGSRIEPLPEPLSPSGKTVDNRGSVFP